MNEKHLIQLREFVNLLVQPNEKEWQAFTDCLFYREVKKKEYFLRVGEICNLVGFVVEGAIRNYVLRDGVEVIRYFILDNNYACEYKSFLTRLPSAENLEALEDSLMLCFSHDDLQQLYQRYQLWERYGRLVSEELFIKLSLRINDLLIKTPEERYLALLEEDPRIAQRIPQYMIASFLGVTPETLSRVRRRIAEGVFS